MSRAGRYITTAVEGERIRAFVPPPLPPDPPIELSGLLQPMERANQALGRLDGVASLLPNPHLFIYFYVRKEAVLSSQIEGTQSSLSDLLLFELDHEPRPSIHDILEVSNYVAAMDHGLRRLREGFPLSLRLIREIHAILLREGRGADKTPGEFRRSQNWIGGNRPGQALFVPPPHPHVPELMGQLENFFHDEEDGLPLLVRAGLAHVQFETIHPFLDGNGRLGRLLVTFLLCSRGVLREPLLYLSLYLKTRRATYYELLQKVRAEGAWEAWLRFFIQGVAETAEQASATAGHALDIFRNDRATIAGLGQAAANALRVHEHFQRHPISTIQVASGDLQLTFPTASAAIAKLVKFGILRETTGRQRGRIFTYSRYFELLSEGTEPLPR
jgi:Fic family protein